MNKRELLKEAVELSLADWRDAEDAYNEAQTEAFYKLMVNAEATHIQAVRVLQKFEANL